MRRKLLVWKLFPAYFAITLASVLVVGVFATVALHEFYYSLTEDDLAARARLLRDELQREKLIPTVFRDLSKAQIPKHRAGPRGAEIPKHAADSSTPLAMTRSVETAVDELARSADVRITLIAPSGKVVADSQSDPARMANHGDRPEIRAALLDRTGEARRRSTTLGVTMLYVAVPVKSGGRVVGVLRMAQPATAIDSRPSAIAYRIGAAGLATALLAAILSLVAARRVTKPLAELQRASAGFAAGDFRSRAPAADIAELAGVAESLNSMAARIEQQLREMARQSAEQAAILSSMREGVLAVADDDRIMILNPASEQLLEVAAQTAAGRSFQEAIRSPALHRFIEQVRRGQQPSAEERVFRTRQGRLVHMSSAGLHDPDGKRLGVVVVLSDITQAAKLDQMRRDFVANVSHELKTPITAIKGYIETLLEIKPLGQDKAREFLKTALRQANRLNAIIDDLLKLAEIEQKAETAQIELKTSPIRPVLDGAAANCRSAARESGISIEIDCPDDIAAAINAPLLERAVTNLIDNAVKYSSEGAEVKVVGERTDGEIAIRVIDNGPGIESEHIARLFERFYRVDTARSRKLGGTGLGLAIVKHVVQAHGGRVDVASTPGEGSTFTIHLPAGSP